MILEFTELMEAIQAALQMEMEEETLVVVQADLQLECLVEETLIHLMGLVEHLRQFVVRADLLHSPRMEALLRLLHR